MKKVETIHYFCGFCNHQFSTEKEALFCEELCSNMDKDFKKLLADIKKVGYHNVIEATDFTRYELKCKKCGRSFFEESEMGCMGPTYLADNRKFKCTNCKTEAYTKEEDFEEVFNNR